MLRFATTTFRATQHYSIVATLFRMVATLFQYCNGMLRWKLSLQIVSCNITLTPHSYGATNIGSVRMSHIYGICCVPFLFGNPLVKSTFFKSLPKKRSDCESQKTGFGFDSKNPLRERILWIHDPFLVFPQKTQNPFLDSEILIWIFPNQSDRFSNYFKIGKCLGFRLAD